MIEKKIEIVSYKTVYEAIDGTEFTSKDECKKYEESARCVLMAKYSKLILTSDTEWNLFEMGSEDFIVDVIKLNNEKDIDVVLQLIALERYTLPSTEYMKEGEEKLIKAFEENSPVFIGRGCENDSFYLYGTVYEMINNLNSFK